MDGREHLLSWIENPRVKGSTPALATYKIKLRYLLGFFTSVAYVDLC